MKSNLRTINFNGQGGNAVALSDRPVAADPLWNVHG
jgi:hypothetical protein